MKETEDRHLDEELKLGFPVLDESKVIPGPEPAIIGGSPAPLNEYPWFARGLEANGEWWGCGGSLVTPEFVLTAAHCNWDTTSGFAIGALCEPYQPGDNCGQKVERIYSSAVYEHPLWDFYNDQGIFKYDYMLVQLESRSTIEPVPMDMGNDPLSGGEPMWVIGTGVNNHILPFPPVITPNKVLHAEIPFIDADTCEDIYDGALPGSTITDVEMCGGPEKLSEPDEGTCSGDSGGPFYDKENDILRGITSYGLIGLFTRCGSYPSVYSRIEGQWEEWIKPTICDNHSEPKPDFCSSGPPPTCGPDEVKFFAEVLTDGDGEEIAYGLQQQKSSGSGYSTILGPIGSFKGSGTPLADDTIYNSELCIPVDECFRFGILDSAGNGLSGSAYYKVEVDDVSIVDSPFATGKNEITTFCT